LKRSFSVAVAVSAALHGALAFLALDVERPEPEPNPVLTFELVQPQSDAPAMRDSGAAAMSDPLPAPRVASADPAPPVEPVAALALAVEPEVASVRAEPQSDAPPTPRAAPPSDAPPAPVLAAIAPGSLAMPLPVVLTAPAPAPPAVLPKPVEPREPMTAEQREMLGERVEDWAENYSRVPPRKAVSWEHQGQRYVATFTEHDAFGETGIGEVVIEIATEADGDRWSTKIRLKQLAFSRFAQFVDRWDRGVALHDDEVDGWLHSNSRMRVAASRDARPELLGKVTASRGVETVFDGPFRRDSIFVGGLETGVRPIAMPKTPMPFGDQPLDPNRVLRFEDAAWLTFYGDGTYAWAPGESAEPSARLALPSAPFYFIGAPDTDLHVKGTVKGRVLVYAPDTIVIDGDLLYARDPRSDAGSDDFLGLVADNHVMVAPPGVTGGGDLTIDAAIYARRRFSVRNYGKKERATLAIYGSLTAGSLSATEPRYRTKIEFDRRLEGERPPGFPMTDRYEVEDWEPAWIAAGDAEL